MTKPLTEATAPRRWQCKCVPIPREAIQSRDYDKLKRAFEELERALDRVSSGWTEYPREVADDSLAEAQRILKGE